jgi:hypothetical protein
MSASRNGTGTFTRAYDWTDDAANSIPITASRFDTEMDGVASELTNSVAADGQTTMSGALKMGGFKVTNVGAGTALTDAVQVDQITDNALQYLGTTGGTSAAYTLNPSPALTGYATGMEFSFTTNADNTGTTTLNISSLGAKNLKKLDESGSKVAIAAGDMKNGISYGVRYDGTDMLVTDASIASISLSTATTTSEGVVELATNAEVTTGTDTSRVSPVSSMKYHQGVAKAWVNFTGTGTVSMKDNYNVSSITDNGTGDYTVNIDTNMANANYCVVTCLSSDPGASFSATNTHKGGTSLAAGSFTLATRGAGANFDCANVYAAVFGDV